MAYICEKLFARWGILEQIRGRIMVPPPGVPVGSLVASGQVALGFQQLSELRNLDGITVLGPAARFDPGADGFFWRHMRQQYGARSRACTAAIHASPDVAVIKQRHGMAQPG